MAGTYSYFHPQPLCPGIQETIDDWREMADRHRPYLCPKCGVACLNIPALGYFNMLFPGSTRADHLAQKLTTETMKDQAEGFRSVDEIQTAMGQAEERAKQMGTPGKQLIGPVDSPLIGETHKPSVGELGDRLELLKDRKAAEQTGDKKALARTAERLNENSLKQAAKSKPKLYKPRNTKADHQNQINASREMRKKHG